MAIPWQLAWVSEKLPAYWMMQRVGPVRDWPNVAGSQVVELGPRVVIQAGDASGHKGIYLGRSALSRLPDKTESWWFLFIDSSFAFIDPKKGVPEWWMSFVGMETGALPAKEGEELDPHVKLNLNDKPKGRPSLGVTVSESGLGVAFTHSGRFTAHRGSVSDVDACAFG